jgi:hypothetical protein
LSVNAESVAGADAGDHADLPHLQAKRFMLFRCCNPSTPQHTTAIDSDSIQIPGGTIVYLEAFIVVLHLCGTA